MLRPLRHDVFHTPVGGSFNVQKNVIHVRPQQSSVFDVDAVIAALAREFPNTTVTHEKWFDFEREIAKQAVTDPH